MICNTDAGLGSAGANRRYPRVTLSYDSRIGSSSPFLLIGCFKFVLMLLKVLKVLKVSMGFEVQSH